MNNFLIFGKGFIGSRLHEAYNCHVSDSRTLFLDDAISEIKKYSPGVIINCIGYIGDTNVDDCEEFKDKTLIANVYMPIILAEAARRTSTYMVHISSGCIYHGDACRPISETEIPDFFDLYYSRTKIYAERALNKDCLIVRIRIPLDTIPHKRNILTKLLSYDRVINAPNSVTFLPHLIDALHFLIEKRYKGIFNVVNSGSLYYSQLLSAYNKLRPHKYQSISYNKLGKTRTNLILSNDKLLSAGFQMPDIHDILDDCVRQYIEIEDRSKFKQS